MTHYLRIWLTAARYSVIRTLMFRGDFFIWALVELFWMTVNVLMVSVIYEHTNSVAGWTKYQMILLVGTSMLIQRFLMGFFWSSIFEMGRNIRSGNFDFFLAQPGNVMFMATTRKLDPDSLANSVIALALVIYAGHELHLHPSIGDLALYALLIGRGLVSDQILHSARGRGTDLIVMGTHGWSGILRWTLGSVAYHVIQATPRPPVLTVGPPRLGPEPRNAV